MRKLALFGALLLVAGCATADDNPSTTTTAAPSTTSTQAVTTTTELPTASRIVSLSSVATEILFAIGAGDQVIAVDDQSNFPADAPMTDLSGFTPNIEAIVSYEPDLVVVSYDPGELVSGLEALGVPVLVQLAAADLDGTYSQIEELGAVTGHIGEAAELVSRIQTELDELVAEVGDRGDGLTYYHEIDDHLYSVTSATFFGQVYSLFGLVNIADEADPDGFGYPQLSSEHIVSADPNLVFLANGSYGMTPEIVAARPGWASMSAVQEGRIFPLDSDVASRWGPRVIDFARAVADAVLLTELEPTG